MKKLLLLPFLALSFLKINSQVIFCPPGAEWHYSFANNLPYYLLNENIKYVKDSIIGGDTLKVLKHSRYYNQINDYYGDVFTYIKQKGDTVYFKNPITQNQWQILYNFNTPVNNGWSNYISFLPGATLTTMYSTTVDSIKTTNINGTILKQLYVTNTYYQPNWLYASQGIIVERIGYTNNFLFNFRGENSTDGDYFSEILCYRDNNMGLKQFSAKSCLTGIESSTEIENKIQVFPNPCNNQLNISVENQNSSSNFEIRLVNLLGEEMLLEKNNLSASQTFQVDMSAFRSGIYFVQLYENKKLIGTQKLIKE